MSDAQYYDRYGDILHEIPELLEAIKAFEMKNPAVKPGAGSAEAARWERRMRVAANAS